MIALRVLAVTGATLVASCGQDAARVQLVPVPLANDCGRPRDANQLAVIAFGDGGEVRRSAGLDAAIDFADFPEDTVQLGVEVFVGGGAVGAAGKTAPLRFADLPDGAQLPIVMAPPGGFCAVGPLNEPRKSPLVARAGDRILVVGGLGPSGPLSTAELYDPATARFAIIDDVPGALADALQGMAGVVLTPLPDDRVALTGGARGLLAVFDFANGGFDTAFALDQPLRAFHGAIASTRDTLIVSGGCQGVESLGCNSTPLRSTIEYDLEGHAIATGASLPPAAIAEGGQLFDIGDGRLVLAGGFGTPGEGYRFAFDDALAQTLPGLAAQPVQIDGGAVLTAFSPDGTEPVIDGPVAMVAPGGGVTALGAAPRIAGARLIALEDGSLLAVGGQTPVATDGDVRVAQIADYDPTTDGWELRVPAATPNPAAPLGAPGDQPGPLTAPSLARLADGTVLVVGGDAEPSTNAWIYRPSLIGPFTGALTVFPTSPVGAGVLTAPDPSTVTRATWLLASPDDTLAARALVGGLRMARGSVRVVAGIESGGLALIAQQVSPNDALVAHLVPGEPARLEQLGAGTVCTGDPVVLPAGAVSATLAVGDGITVRIGDTTVLACSYTAAATGAWGVAASGAGARITVATVTVARPRQSE